jgi:hypothetical protein
MNISRKTTGNDPLERLSKTGLLLIDGYYSPQDALDIITRMVHVKIKFHESKINECLNEEDIKMREKRIVDLQRDLYEMRRELNQRRNNVALKAEIEL